MAEQKLNKKQRKKSNIEDEIEETFEIDLNSDYPVHEKYVKEKKIRKMNKRS
ncbi:hypothetical protein HY772_07965 [Candidatus Woesearchaeota archaeon]|nr:hypothetical protein [Candidatus Woesearchaeota archaeon]